MLYGYLNKIVLDSMDRQIKFCLWINFIRPPTSMEQNVIGIVQGNSAIAAAGESELVFTNTHVHRITRISKTNQDIPNL